MIRRQRSYWNCIMLSVLFVDDVVGVSIHAVLNPKKSVTLHYEGERFTIAEPAILVDYEAPEMVRFSNGKKSLVITLHEDGYASVIYVDRGFLEISAACTREKFMLFAEMVK